jgi:hypothetical protein
MAITWNPLVGFRCCFVLRGSRVMEWSRKSYTRSHWLPGTKYGTNRAHGHLLHLEQLRVGLRGGEYPFNG